MAIKRTIKRNEEATYTLMGEALSEFIAEKQILNKAQSTIDNYKLSVELYMKFSKFSEDDDINKITLQSIYKWMNTMKLEGAKITSINHHIRDLRTFVYWCMNVDRKYIEVPYKIPLMEGQEETFKMFNDDELEALLVKPPRNDKFVNWRTWAIVNWVLATGNRAATICEVRIGDINYNQNEIVLRHTKNKKAQIIPLSSSLQTVLKEYTNMWRSVKDDKGTKVGADDFLFSDIGQEQLTTNALKLSFARYCKARGVNRTNIHGLRHNFAKMWITNNGSMAKLQRILGHSTMEMTRRYVKLFGEDLKDDFDKFSPLDTIKKKAKRTNTLQREF